ncbi:chemotaxis protein CheA [bacterium]|nr:chemotaxis protein CheA [bacterium]
MTPEEQEQRELLQSFVEEGRELIDDAEPLIIELESQAAEDESGDIDPETINTIFRLFHSLKGGAGFLDLTLISRVTHEAETLLDLFRKGQGKLTAAHIDLINRASDFLRKLLDQIDSVYHEAGHEEEADQVAAELRKEIAALKGGEDEEDDGPVVRADDMFEVVTDESDDSAEESEEEPVEEEVVEDLPEVNSIPITPEILSQFATESEEQLQTAEECLIRFEKDTDDESALQEAFRALHSFKGNCGFVDFKDMMALANGAETVLDLYRNKKVEYNPATVSLLLEIIDFLRNTLKTVPDTGNGSIPAAPGLLHLLEDTVGKEVMQAQRKEKTKPRKAAVPEAKSPAAEPKAEVKPEAPAAEPEKPKTAAPAKPEAKPATNGAAKPAAATPPPAAQNQAAQRQSVRVDVEKVDRLLDLVGELVIAEAMVAQNQDLQDVDIPLDRFERAVMQLNKITRDLQDISTSIRMIPLSGTFRRMFRLVRDVAQKSKKKVELTIEGEETEVDKTVIENITDPLVHILRNSIDHGIESPKEREEAGKSPTGHVAIRAYYVGGEVWISIKDDGKGLDRDRILNKALERGIVTPEEAETIPNDEVWQLIFQPGFSTAEKVTDVSGRGVGMDVVRRNLESIRGKVDVKSEAGKGSEVVLRIPLTLAIIDGMLLRVGKEKYVIPITTISESLQVTEGMITRPMDGREIIRVRDDLIPVIRLHDQFSVEADSPDLTKGIVTILEVDGQQFGLFVDELLGQHQIVIKGLSDYITDQPCVSGCTILGDGGICLILDIGGIMKQVNRKESHKDLETARA